MDMKKRLAVVTGQTLVFLAAALTALGCGDSSGNGEADGVQDVVTTDKREGGPGDIGLELPGDLVTDLASELAPDLPDATAELPPELKPQDIPPADLGPPPPVTPYVEPELLEGKTWLVSYVPDPSNDPVGDALDAGTFELPAGPGKDANGVEWTERVPEEGGKMGYAGYGTFYAAVGVDLAQGENVVVRADKFYRVYLNGVQQPGDPYTSRKHRTPMPGIAGTNVVVAMAYQALNDPEIELAVTDAEVYFNPKDLTAPHLVVGETYEQYFGVPVLNLIDEPIRNATALVVENDYFEETEVPYPALPPAATTQLAFHLVPKLAAEEIDQVIPVTVRIESHSLDWSYERDFELTAKGTDGPFKRTRRSHVDHSVQFYGVKPPSNFDPGKDYSLLLSLHGAGVGGNGQAGSYGAKDWVYHIAPTNRRPFGFDWEEWGRLDGVEALEHAMDVYNIDPSHVYVSGHSMGGHGTWQFGVLLSGRFGVVGPSAGWSSFYSYGGGSPEPTGPFARARASSNTLNYVSNLTDKPVYIIHGDADDNVPISEAYLMAEAVEKVTDDFYFHIEPGAGHWWNGDAAPGADCVDWPPLFELMQERSIDPLELDFEYKCPSPWVNAKNSYVTIRSQIDPYEDSTIASASDGDTVALTTYNVRSMVLDGAGLTGKGVESLTVDGKDVELTNGDIEWGPQGGKNQAVQGPFNQVFHRPFCFLYPDDGSWQLKSYASFLTSTWNIIGNGHACALPVSQADADLHANYNLIYVGVPRDEVPLPDSIPFDWNDTAVIVGDKTLEATCLVFVFPEEGHLSAAMVTPPGYEYLLFWHSPFSSRSGLPDYTAWTHGGANAAGFFDADWNYDPALGIGQ